MFERIVELCRELGVAMLDRRPVVSVSVSNSAYPVTNREKRMIEAYYHKQNPDCRVIFE